MKKLVFSILFGLFLLLSPATMHAEEKGEAESGSLKAWEWANFALLAAGLGYVIVKNAGPAFDARGRRIRKEMVEAEEAKKEADTRAAEVERRLARLADEIAALRAEAQREEEAEAGRYARNTAAEIAKIRASAEQEIVSAGKAARSELKRHAAELALALAEQKLRSRITPDTEDRLVRGFVKHIETASAAHQG
jgi:F-type H+-transporting ATPase subunit b